MGAGAACAVSAGRFVQFERRHPPAVHVREPVLAGEIAHARTRTERLTAITVLLDAGWGAGDHRDDVTAVDVAAALIGVFTVAPRSGSETRAARLLDLLMDGLRPRS